MEAFWKTLISLLSTVVALFPLWLILLAKMVLEPHGFWQKLILYGAGVYFLGGLQIVLLIFLVVWLVCLWSN